MRAAPHRSRAGWTILEVMLAIGVLGVTIRQAVIVLAEASQAAGSSSLQMQLEDQARQTLDRLALSIMSSDRETLMPAGEGVHLERLRYRASLGVEDGGVVWDDPEEVGLGEAANQVVWREQPDEPDERRVVWSNAVAAFLEGEVPNGIDDNGNGLIDETGLSIVVDGASVQIRLTLERLGENDQLITETVETVVAVRN